MLIWNEIGRPDILWSVNKLARSVTQWTEAHDRRMARLISYIHHTWYCQEIDAFSSYCNVARTCGYGCRRHQRRCVAPPFQRTSSHIEEALAKTNLPMPPVPTPLWRQGSVPGEWADVRGFQKPPCSEAEWQVWMDAAFTIPLWHAWAKIKATTTRYGCIFLLPTPKAVVRRDTNKSSGYTPKKELRHMTTAMKEARLTGNNATTIRAIFRSSRWPMLPWAPSEGFQQQQQRVCQAGWKTNGHFFLLSLLVLFVHVTRCFHVTLHVALHVLNRLQKKKKKFKQEELESVGEWSEVCSQIVPKNPCIWHELDDLTFYGRSTSLRDQSQNGLRHMTDDKQDWFRTFFTQTISGNIFRKHGTAL